MSVLGNLLRVENVKFIVATSVITTIAVLSLRSFVSSTASVKQTIASPRDTQLPNLSKEEQEALPYPPDAFPGARDVVSPYGTIRVYEWGPDSGRKVLLIHGISTPCVSLGGVAQGLVEKGCRVMLLDLWGRGYSDMIDLPLDSRLYTTEILLAITSSPLPWTPEGFSIVGYSMGGGITVDFASYFPDMVKSIILLAPAGLVRSHHFSKSSRALFKGFVPESFLEWLIHRRMGGAGAVKNLMEKTETGDQDNPTTKEELKGNRDPQFESAVLSLDKSKSVITIADVIQWQVDNHKGFFKSFISSARYSSIENRHETWRKLSMRKDKVLIIAGTADPVIISKELREDAEATIGLDKMDFREIVGGHEFAVTYPTQVVDIVSEFWGL